MTAFAKQSSSSGGTGSFTVDDIHRILWHPEVYYKDHKTPLRIPILSRMDPINIVTSCFRRSGLDALPFQPESYILISHNSNMAEARTSKVKETLAPFDLGF
jgi:hypothetical protein